MHLCIIKLVPAFITSDNGLFCLFNAKPLSEPLLVNHQLGPREYTSVKSESKYLIFHTKLEQLERLRSEDTPRRLMITNTIESYWILSQKYNRSRTENVTEGTRFQNQGRTTLKI